MGRSFEELWDEMTGKQQHAFHMKVWAALGGRETGEEGMKQLMSGQARLTLKNVIQKSKWQSLVDACLPDAFYSNDFTEDHWPLESIAADEADWEVKEHHIMRVGTLKDGLRQLEELAAKGDIRLLTGSRRAMEYMAQHLDAQLFRPVILPLRAQNQKPSDDYSQVPIFGRNWGNRRLYGLLLHYACETFNPRYSWLVLKRKQK